MFSIVMGTLAAIALAVAAFSFQQYLKEKNLRPRQWLHSGVVCLAVCVVCSAMATATLRMPSSLPTLRPIAIPGQPEAGVTIGTPERKVSVAPEVDESGYYQIDTRASVFDALRLVTGINDPTMAQLTGIRVNVAGVVYDASDHRALIRGMNGVRMDIYLDDEKTLHSLRRGDLIRARGVINEVNENRFSQGYLRIEGHTIGPPGGSPNLQWPG